MCTRDVSLPKQSCYYVDKSSGRGGAGGGLLGLVWMCCTMQQQLHGVVHPPTELHREQLGSLLQTQRWEAGVSVLVGPTV